MMCKSRNIISMSILGTVVVGAAAFLPAPMTASRTTSNVMTRTNLAQGIHINVRSNKSNISKLPKLYNHNIKNNDMNKSRWNVFKKCLVSFSMMALLTMGRAAWAATLSTSSPIASLEVPSLNEASLVQASSAAASKLKAEVELCWRLIYASIGGALVGLERSTSDHPAGVRTMALVSLGACAFTLCSMFGFLAVAASSSAAKLDPSRMASNVASGVGFIGAGVITNNRKSSGVYDRQSSVNGLTTAAAIWVAAAVGVASGVGLYVVAGTAAASTIAILRFSKLKNTGISNRVLRVAKKQNTYSSSSSKEKEVAPPTKDVVLGDSINKPELIESNKVEPSLSSSKVADPLVEKYLWGIHETQQQQEKQPTRVTRSETSSKRASSSSTSLNALSTPSEPSISTTNNKKTTKQTIREATWDKPDSNPSTSIQVSDILDAAANSSTSSKSIVPQSPKISIEEEQQVILNKDSSAVAPLRTSGSRDAPPSEKSRERRSSNRDFDSPKP